MRFLHKIRSSRIRISFLPFVNGYLVNILGYNKDNYFLHTKPYIRKLLYLRIKMRKERREIDSDQFIGGVPQQLVHVGAICQPAYPQIGRKKPLFAFSYLNEEFADVDNDDCLRRRRFGRSRQRVMRRRERAPPRPPA